MSFAPRLPVAVLGATGSVGQRFVELLAEHPWFELAAVTASERSAGRTYREAARWFQTRPMPPAVADMVVRETEPEATRGCALVFSALDAAAADGAEPSFADAGHVVVSNARSYRMAPDVPLVVPEVNPDHVELVRHQRWHGSILTNPNCSTIGLVLALKPLDDAFGVERVNVVSLQALSGAGVPGVPSLQAVDNVVPFIGGEEDKLENEPAKILGKLEGDAIRRHGLRVSAQANRVAVIDGHTLCVSVGLRRKPTEEEMIEAWRGFRGEPQERSLPSAPRRPVHYLEDEDAPQPRLHRDLDGGMAASVGRLRPCPLFDFKFVTLSHNTIRGAAGGALLVAELAAARGLVPGFSPPAGDRS